MSNHIPAESLSFQHLGKDVRLPNGSVGNLYAVHFDVFQPTAVTVDVYDFGLLRKRSHLLGRASRVEVLDEA